MTRDDMADLRRRKQHDVGCQRCGAYTGYGYVYCTPCRAARAHPHQPKAEFPRRLPAAPLYEHVRRHVEANAERDNNGNAIARPVLENLGLSCRRYYEWKKERSLDTSIDIADTVLTALGLDWFDVWPRDRYPDIAACIDKIDNMDEAA